MTKVTRTRRRSFATGALLLTASFVAASFVTAAPARATVTSTEYQMARYINSARTSRGLRALSVSSSLSDLSRVHSRAMADAGSLFHTRNLAYVLRNYSWRVAGENVGRGPSIYAIYKAFMDSYSHRSNILYRYFTRVGVGVVWRSGLAYVTITFLG